MSTVLKIENLCVYYFTRDVIVRAVNDVSFSIEKGEIMGLVGESGSGKSTLALSIMRLVPSPGRIVNGKIFLDNTDLTKLPEKEMGKIRGSEISMVFQDPMTSLDPLMRVGDQIVEMLKVHTEMDDDEAKKYTMDLFETVGIKKDRFYDYPHQLSGGMRQRIMIAMAVALKPKLIIADEPTTALDVIVQAQIMDLFKDLREKFGTSIMLISHDIALILEVADKVGVMYGGQLMEFSSSRDIVEKPLHPYTKELLKAVPNIEIKDQKLVSIPGNPPDLFNPPKGCVFHPRCPVAMEICREKEPKTINVNGRIVKCWLYR